MFTLSFCCPSLYRICLKLVRSSGNVDENENDAKQQVSGLTKNGHFRSQLFQWPRGFNDMPRPGSVTKERVDSIN